MENASIKAVSGTKFLSLYNNVISIIYKDKIDMKMFRIKFTMSLLVRISSSMISSRELLERELKLIVHRNSGKYQKVAFYYMVKQALKSK